MITSAGHVSDMELTDEISHQSTDFTDHHVQQLKELDKIYKKLVVKSRPSTPKYSITTQQRTLLPGAHVRKLGIRLKTAKQLSEKPQTASALTTGVRGHLKSAQPRVNLEQHQVTQEEVRQLQQSNLSSQRSNLSTSQSQVRAGTSLPQTTVRLPHNSTHRKGVKSAPAASVRRSAASRLYDSGELPSPRRYISTNNSLALYSPQTQRFTIEQLALEQSRLLKRLSHIQTHRVDQKFYVSGTHFDPRERYDIDDEQYKLLLEITSRGKHTNRKLANLRLSDRIQHFTPNPSRRGEHHTSYKPAVTKDNNTHTEHHTIPSPREGAEKRAEKRACGEPSVTQRQIPADNNEEPSLQGGDAVDMMTSPTGETAGEAAAASGGEECDIIEREDRPETENVRQQTPNAASDNDDNNNSQGKPSYLLSLQSGVTLP